MISTAGALPLSFVSLINMKQYCLCQSRPEHRDWPRTIRNRLDGGIEAHLTSLGWSCVTAAGKVRPPLSVAPVSRCATVRRCAEDCWPAPPPPPAAPRSARGLWRGSASSRGREIAPRCDPRCRRESVGSFERPAVLQGFPLHRLVSAALAASGTFANLSGSTPAECLRRRVK